MCNTVQGTLLRGWQETNACAEPPQSDVQDYEVNEGSEGGTFYILFLISEYFQT